MEDFSLGPVNLKAWHITLCVVCTESFPELVWRFTDWCGIIVIIEDYQCVLTQQHNTLIYCMLKTVVMRPVTVMGQRHSPTWLHCWRGTSQRFEHPDTWKLWNAFGSVAQSVTRSTSTDPTSWMLDANIAHVHFQNHLLGLSGCTSKLDYALTFLKATTNFKSCEDIFPLFLLRSLFV